MPHTPHTRVISYPPQQPCSLLPATHHAQVPQTVRVVLAPCQEVFAFVVKLNRGDFTEVRRHGLNTNTTDSVPESDMLVFGSGRQVRYVRWVMRSLLSGCPNITYPDAITLPVGSNVTASVLCACPENVRTNLPASTSHRRRILS